VSVRAFSHSTTLAAAGVLEARRAIVEDHRHVMDVTKKGDRTRVVVVGGGHAGFHVARRLLQLRKPGDSLEIVVASSETSEVYHGLMPQIVGGRVQARNVLVPLRNHLRGVILYHYDVERIDLANRKVYLDPVAERPRIELSYDYLVLALGSVTDLSRFPGLKEHGLQTKTIGDVYHLHDHLLEMLERAAVEEDGVERQRLLTFVVVGAGYAGVEMGAEANNLLRSALRLYPGIRQDDLHVAIVSHSERVLPAMTEKLAAKAAGYLTRTGVTLRLRTALTSATAGEVVLSSGERLQTRTIIVTAGVAPHPIVRRLDVEKDRGRIKTDEYCRVPGFDGVYAAGDNAAVPHHRTGEPCPQTFLYAISQGACAADNIIADVRGKPRRRYRFHSFSEIAQLGSTFGLLQLGRWSFSGWLTSILVRVVFFVSVPSWRCRLGLISDWASAAVLPPDLTRMTISRTDMIVPLRFTAGQEIIRQGEPGSRFYMISSGRVEVVRRQGGDEEVLATLGPGQYFGEVALLHATGRTATVRALEDTTVLSIAREDFATLVENLPVLREAFSPTARAAQPPSPPEPSG
jgi:NADH dehydrogenase